MAKSIFILLLSLSVSSFAQPKYIGTPNIRNYPKTEYNAGTQNWAIDQDQNGLLYVANNDGLLCFNGIEWNLIPITSSLPLRSVCVDRNNTIYVGMINDFGTVNRDEPGPPVFESLKNLLPPGFEEFDDVWRIHEFEDEIVFQSFKYLFIYKDDKISVIEPLNSFLFSFKIDNQLFIQEQDLGVYKLWEGSLEKLPFWDSNSEKNISIILEMGDDKMLIGTSYDGIYIYENNEVRKWDTPVNELLIMHRLYSATKLSRNYYAFGTITSGLIISDSEGNIVQTIDINQGIQNNTVLSLFLDHNEGLWVGLDNGIGYLETNSPLSYISPRSLGTGYSCIVFNENIYLGTNQGLFVRPFTNLSNDSQFELVKNTAGQVWSIEEFGGELICGHNLGTYQVNGQSATKICNEEGAWKYIPLKNNPDLIIGGHFNGLILLKKENNEWKYLKKIKGFNESSRYLFQDEDGYIWIGHSGKGIFRVELSEDLDDVKEVISYKTEKGLPSNTGNILLKYNNKILVSTSNGIYQYDKISDSFQFSEQLSSPFSNSGKVKTIITDDKGDIWYIADEESGIIHFNVDMTSTVINIPFKKLNMKYVKEFEFIYLYDNENVFFGVENGFAHFSPTIPKTYNETYKSYITRVELPYFDSVLYIQNNKPKILYEFPFKKSSFRFHFAAPFFENEIPVKFSYFLEGFSEEWSDWSDDSYKDFTSLQEGSYQLRLKSKNVYGVESEPAFFDFEITPPWQRSKLAWTLYIFLGLASLILMIRLIKHQYKQSLIKEELKYKEELQKRDENFKLETLLAEKEIINLKNEKLKSEMVYRDKELANQTLGIIEKNKFLIKVNEDLNSIKDSDVCEEAKEKICRLKSHIRREIDIEKQNKIFESYFDEVHEEFFRRLKEKFPALTTTDLRLCAFIRMNISTKEIATILNISYRGTEVSRYRLRKKMELSREINLSSFLASI